jgi:beta-N-acetylhexosaminidase
MKDDLNSLPLEQKVGQLFFIGIPGPEVDAATRLLLDDISPGGVCLFARNIREAAQTRSLLDKINRSFPVTPFLSIDQEGGLVDRLRRIMTPMPAANKIRTTADAEDLAEIIADTLLTLGLNMDFAPVVDVINQERAKFTNGLFSREFGRSEEDVVSLAGKFLNRLQAGGVIGCVKHFPGLGASQVDSHEELPTVDISETEFGEIDLVPYRKLIASGDARAIMVAHASYPSLRLQETDQSGKLIPASLSKSFITTLLRDRLGFSGLVVTDDLEMGAIKKNFGIGEACKMALNAGADMLAICADPVAIRDGFAAVLDAVQRGTVADARVDESIARIAELKGKLSEPAKFDAGKISIFSERTKALAARLS